MSRAKRIIKAKKHLIKPTRTDWLVVLTAPILAALVTIIFQTSFLVSTILFFVVPSVYLSLRSPKFVKKLLLGLTFSIPFTIIISYFATRDGTWLDSTIFPFRMLNGFALEDFIWFAAWFYYIILFYEYFVDQPLDVRDAPINSRFWKFLGAWIVALFVFAILYVFLEKYLHIPYFYLVFATVLGVIPLVFALIRRPKFLHKLFIVGAYFFFLSLLQEYGAFAAKQWTFPGKNFLGWVSLQGGFGFPIEELIFWMMFGAVFLLVNYEYLFDDAK